MQASGSQVLPVRVLSEREDLDRPKLIIPVTLTQAEEDLSSGDSPKSYKTVALIDTGAAISCVSTHLLAAIAADSWDQVKSFGIGGARTCYYHFIDLDMLDNDKVRFAHFPSLKVIDFESHPQDDVGVLIGMDVLGQFSEIRIQGFVLEFGALLR